MTTREEITAALLQFSEADLYDAGINLFEVLGYNTSRTDRLDDNTFVGFAEMFIQDTAVFRADKAMTDEWAQVEFLFQLTELEMTSEVDLFDTKEFNGTIMESYAFFALELKGETYTRSQLAQITREFNKLFNMPAMLVFKHGPTLTLAVINRRLHKRDNTRDVLEKVTLIKDIRFYNPHRAHLEILFDLSFEELLRKYSFSNFVALHDAWTKCLDTKELNKRFYQELANWYFWAMDKVSFPDDIEKNEDIRNATNLIRLITRIVFVWFIKEKGLVPDILFNQNSLTAILKDFNKNNKSHNYYHAILQNLFFGTLNQKMDERAFAKDAGFPGNRNEYGVKNLFRYANKFTITEEEVLALFAGIPFLNGGLFDCLDKEDKKSKVEYVDGFSREPKKQAIVPDYLFFSKEQGADLNEIYGTKNKRYHVKGLINILDSYKFTVAENTPLEEEIALDPELLGKVFENLLASYNPETQTTARKQTGSFYTPREIVNYMVDESLLAYLQQKLEEMGYTDCEDQLRDLLSYSENPNPFDDNQTNLLIQAIDNCKILDPACGSGAFPMGVLLKLVHLLQKLDPENAQWKERQQTKARIIDDPEIRQQALDKIEDAFINNELDYGRKLFLIENCIYGVDIQPVAVQIAKLRFFISLIIDQKIQPTKDNLGIQSLPNLETKFVAANTLIELEKPDVQGTLRNPEIVKLENELKDLRHQYFNARTRNEKLKYQRKDKKLRQEIAGFLVNDGWDNRVAQQIVDFNPYDQNKFAPFFDSEWMFGVKDGFNIVIGNPPYVQLQKIKELAVILENQGYETFAKSADIYCLFIEKGIKLLIKNGFLFFITSNSWMQSKYGKLLRNYLAINTCPILLINFEDVQIFESAIVESNILLTKRAANVNNLKAVNVSSDFVKSDSSIADYFKENYVKIKEFKSSGWIIGEPMILELKRKIEADTIALSSLDVNINFGIKTGFNKAFIISEQVKDELIQKDEKNKVIIKPILKGRDLRKYCYEFSGNWLINTHNGIKSKNILPVNVKEEYPSIYQFLYKYRAELERRSDKGFKWTNLRNCTYLEDFNKPKILWGELSDSPKFAYDDKGLLAEATLFIMTGEKLKYLLSIMNSKLGEWYFNQISTTSGMGTNRWKKYKIEQMRIKTISKEKQRLFERMVEYITTVKSNNAIIATYFETILDLMVYEIYLTKEVNTADANILCHLDNLPDIQPLIEKDQTEKARKTIEKVYQELSDPNHPVNIAMIRMQEIEEVQIIEGEK